VWNGRFSVRDEFAPLRSVLLHYPANARDLSMDDIKSLVPPDELTEHPECGPISKARVEQQHARLEDVMDEFRVAVEAPVEVDGALCQVFTRDPCFVVGDRLFIGAFRDDYRHPELAGLSGLRARSAHVVELTRPGATLEGGDVFVLRDATLVLVGTHRHTNPDGIDWLAEQLEPVGAQVVQVPHRALHLDCCLAPLPNGEALFTAGKLPEASLDLVRPFFTRLHPLDEVEGPRHLAANLLWLNPQDVVSNVATPVTNALLGSLGFRVEALDISDLVAMWGGVRCATCPLQRS
jgi:N-dimethylarginine dimethylaminohydrolase